VGRDLALEERIQHDPAGVLRELRARLAHVRDADAPELVRLAAAAEQRLGHGPRSLRAARRAVRAARASGAGPATVSRALTTLSAGLVGVGRMSEAATVADDALRSAAPEDRAMALVYRGQVHMRTGESRAASRCYRQAERSFRAAGDLTSAAGARFNVGLVRALTGDARGALADLDEVERLIDEGADLPRFLVEFNRAHALVQLGDYAEGLAEYDRIEAVLRAAGIDTRTVQIDQLEALANAGLAVTVLQRATVLLQLPLTARIRAGVELLAAEAHRAQGDADAALTTARRAHRRLRRVGDGHDAARATVLAGEVARASGHRVARPSLERSTSIARHVHDRPLRVRADALLSRVGAGRRPRLEQALGDPSAEAAVLLAQAESAIARGRRSQVLHAIDRLSELRHARRERSTTLRAPASAPPGTADLVTIALRDAVRAGDPRHLAAVVQRARALSLPLGTRLPATDVTGRHLDFFTLGPDIVRCTTVDGRASAHGAGTVDDVTRLIRFARLDRARAARTGGPGANGAAGELSACLLGEAPLAADGPLHVTAAPRLAFVPWGALGGLRAQTWSLVVAAGVPPRAATASDEVTVIVGPDLPNGASEAQRVAGHYAAATLFDADAATPQEALAALGRGGIVHLAAHAGRRGDDPLLSWIELAGGALSNSTLVAERVRAGCVVLSACEAAAAAGDVSAGIVTPAAIIVRRGAAAVVAATDPVHHDDAEELMDALHARLAAGEPTADALRTARAALPDNPAAASFVCLTAVA
jgi:tetratricopeptide (TPR) repeat protein